MRLFIAIPLPGSVKQTLNNLKESIEGVRWQPAHQLHITLKFLGETPDKQLKQLKTHLRAVNQPAFNLSIQGLGTFPKKRKPKVIWAGVKKTEKLKQLWASVEDACANVGFEKESRSFTPHVTLAKVKNVPVKQIYSYLDKHSAWSTEEDILIRQFVLYASHLTAEGATHLLQEQYLLTE